MGLRRIIQCAGPAAASAYTTSEERISTDGEPRTAFRWRRVAFVVATICILLAPLAYAGNAGAATRTGGTGTSPWISSDLPDYPPGATVNLLGGSWQPGESVHINVNDSAGQTWVRDVDITADSNGDLTDTFNLPDWFVATYSVTATAATSGTATYNFTDSNVGNISGAASVSEGGSGSYSAQISGCNAANPCSYTWSVTAGNATITSGATGTVTATTSVPAGVSFGDGPSSVNLRLTATGGTSGNASTSNFGITINNVAPAVTITGNATPDEGATEDYNYSVSDPGGDAFTLGTPSCGTGTLVQNMPNQSRFRCRFLNGPASTSVSLSATDKDGATGTGPLSISVQNVNATVTAPANQTATQGQSVSIGLGSFSDPGAEASWSVTVNWGDGSSNDTFNVTGNATNAVCSASCSPGPRSHTYATTGAKTVTVTVNDGTGSGQAQFTVTVNPACTAVSVTQNPADQTVTYPNNATFVAAASGNPAPTVQWQLDSGSGFTNIAGATNTTLTLTKPPVSASGNKYRAVFSNTCGGTQTATSTAATLTVNRKAITITPDSGQSKVFGTSDPPLTYTNTPALQSGDSFTGALGRAPGENVGSYAINLGTLSAGNNYTLNLSTPTVNFAITKANADCSSIAGYHVTYDGNEHSASGNCVAIDGHTVLAGLDKSGTKHTNAGDYPSDPWTFTDVSGNYHDTSGSVHDQIDKAQLTVTANDKSKFYDGSAFTAFTRSITGFVNGESESVISGSVTYTGSAVGAINADSYTITPDVSGLSATNYSFKAVSGTLTIKKVNLTVKADDKSKIYDGSPFTAFTRTITGFVNGESESVISGTVTYNGTAVGATAVGTYPITPVVSGLSATNYLFTPANGALTITPWDASGKGFYAPIGSDSTHSVFTPAPASAPSTKPIAMVWNTAKGGSTIPLKFNVYAGGVEKTGSDTFPNSDLTKAFQTQKLNCTDNSSTDPVDFTTTTGQTTLRYDTTGMQWIQNWATPKASATTCYRTWVTFADGSTLESFFQLTK